MEKKNFKTVISIVVINFLSRVMSFLKLILLSAKFGASFLTDAFILAESIPNIFFGAITASINFSFIPVYSKVEKEGGKEAGDLFTSRILNITVVSAFIVSLLGIIFSRQIVEVIGTGFNQETSSLAVRFTRIFMPTVIFTGMVQVMIGYLQSNKQYILSAAFTIPLNLLVIVMILMSDNFGINGVILAVLVGASLQVVVLLPGFRRTDYKYRLSFGLNTKWIRYMIKLIVPVLIGSGIYQLNIMIDRLLASSLREGSISSLNIGYRLSEFAMGLITIAISTFIYPKLAKVADEEGDTFKDMIRNSIASIILIVMPVMALMITLRSEIINVLFQRGAFTQGDTIRTSGVLMFYSVGMVFSALRYIITRVFYSMHDMKTSMVNGTIALFINIALNLILVRFMEADGLALATSIAAGVTTILLLKSLANRIGDIGYGKIGILLIKVSVATIVMCAGVILGRNIVINSFMGNNIIMKFIILIGIGIPALAFYMVILYMLKCRELRSTVGMFRKNK